MAFDVFISYASKDKIVADAVCARLEASGIRCWIAPRDIVAGTSYGEAIIDAIHGAKVMVLVFSSSANASGHIPKEVERAVSNGVAVLPFRIEDVAPGKSLDYFIGSVHWLDAMTPPMEKHLDDLAATVHKLLPAKAGETQTAPTDATVMWQRNAAGSAAQHAPTVLASAAGAGASKAMADTARTAAAGGAGPRAGSLNSKTILIGAAAVLVLAAVVVGMMLMRGEGIRRARETCRPRRILPAATLARTIRMPGQCGDASGKSGAIFAPVAGCGCERQRGSHCGLLSMVQQHAGDDSR